MPKKKRQQLTPVGKKIRDVRIKNRLSLDRIATEIGQKSDYIKQIEAGEVIPSVGVLLQIAKTLGLDSGSLLKDRENTAKERAEAFTKRTQNYSYEALTPDADDKHIKAFRVSVDPHSRHEGVGYCHEGEEFIYVLDGQIEVVIGENTRLICKGESLHFNSGIRHQVTNPGEETSIFLVVIYGP
jgi:quercetin dioxygenase-like cupin family protein